MPRTWPLITLLCLCAGNACADEEAPPQVARESEPADDSAREEDEELGAYLRRAIELSIDLHGGMAWTQSDLVTIDEENTQGAYDSVPFNPQPHVDQDYFRQRVGSAEHPTFGGRLTAWVAFPDTRTGLRVALGGALEGSYWSAESDFVTRHNVFRAGALMLFRLETFRTKELPHGLFRPYVGGGVGGAVSSLALNLPASSGGPVSDTAVGFNLSARGGLSIRVVQEMAIYVEYGLEWVTASVRPNIDSPNYGYRLMVDRSILTHTLVVGISLCY